MKSFPGRRLKQLTFVSISAISLAILSALSAGKVLAFSGSGTGTSGDPYQITDCAQLESIDTGLTADYVLANDIDCSTAGSLNGGSGWSPIGSGSGFQGTLDGQGHKINSLDLSNMPGSTSFEGMFSTLSNNAVVKNLSIINGKINGGNNIGMVAGSLSGTSSFDNVYVRATVTCHAENCGGMVGSLHNASLINNSGADVTVTSSDQSTGGLVGYIADDGAIQESYADGSVSGALYVGGLVGAVNNSGSPATITNAYSSATVTDSGDFAGGLIGLGTTLNLTNAYAAGSVSGGGAIGGLVGYFDGFMAETFSAEEIHGTGTAVGPVTGDFVGGSVGNRYFDSHVTGFSSSADGSSPISSSAYFKDNSSNPPFDQWDFTTIWRINYANYPSFAPKVDPYMLCEAPRSTHTTITGSCEVLPLGWGTPTWHARWGVHNAHKWHTITLTNAHQAAATVTGLTPGTWYDLQFRYTNNFGTGPWGTVEILTTGTAPKDTVANNTSTVGTVQQPNYPLPVLLATIETADVGNSGGHTGTSAPAATSVQTPSISSAAPKVEFKNAGTGRSHRAYFWVGAGIAAIIVVVGLLIRFRPKHHEAS